jgi:RNA-binding protein YhbY
MGDKMRGEMIQIQLGKQGFTPGVLELLKKTFKNHELIKISVLKSCTRDRNEIKTISEKICSELEKSENKRFASRIIGFTINLRRLKSKLKNKLARENRIKTL